MAKYLTWHDKNSPELHPVSPLKNIDRRFVTLVMCWVYQLV